VLEPLVALVRSDGELPAWHTPGALLPPPERREYPGGLLDCGLAHGLPGLLALFALSLSAGSDVAGLRDAIRVGAAWLRGASIEDPWGPNWPFHVPLAGGDGGGAPARAAWCYGAPGVARALWLAGAATADDDLRRLAVDAIEAVHRRPAPERRVPAPIMCHGTAGLLQITLRLAADADSTHLRASAAELAAGLVDAFEPDSLFGYRDLDPDGTPADRAGVLEGAAGVLLALLSAASAAEPRWDRMFLLA
jgi:hypothetical protein